MAQRALVNAEIEAAGRLVAFLDAHGFPVKAALWLYQSDAERWRFMVSLQEKRQNVATFYADLTKLIREKGQDGDLLALDRVSFVDADGGLVAPLAAGMRGVRSEGRHLIDEQINGVFVEEALIYRLPA